MQNWRQYDNDYTKSDPDAFIFSLDLNKIYKPSNPSHAIYTFAGYGPCFGERSLSFVGNPMNSKNESRCWTNGYGGWNPFNIPADLEGNNEVTGQGSKQKND